MLNLKPCDEQSLVLRVHLGVGSGRILTVEEIASTVGRGLHNNHCVRLGENTRASRAHDVLGRLALRLLPQTHLGKMHQRVSTATTTVRTLGSTYLNLALTLRHTVRRTRFADTDKFRLVLRIDLAQPVQELHRVLLNHEVEHIFDFVRCRALVGDDERVETFLVEELQPRHVELRGCGAAPLTRFQENKTDRLASLSFRLKARHEDALRIPQTEKHVLSCVLVVDIDERSRPKWKVVLVAQAYERARHLDEVIVIRLNVHHGREKLVDRASLDQLLDKRNIHHLHRQPLNRNGKVGNADTDTFTNRPLTSNRVKLGEHDFIAPVILRKQCGNLCIYRIGCHTIHSLCGK